MTSPGPASIVALLGGALSAHAGRLRALSERARAGGDDELVHDVRVALRRLEAHARLFRGVPKGGDGAPARAASRDLRRRLSLLRSEEVGRALLATRVPPGEAAGVVALAFPGALPVVRVGPADLAPVTRELSAWRRRLASSLDGAFAPRAAADERLRRRTQRSLGKRLSELLRLLPPRAKSLHAARIAAKRARYALEAIEPLRPDGRPLLRQLRAFQDAAGNAHDLVELAERLHAAAAPGAGAAGELSRLALEVGADAARAVSAARRGGALLEAPARRLRAALRRPETR